MRVLTVTNMWPSAARPHWGVFVRSQVESLVAAGIENTLYEIEGWKSAGEYFKAAHRIPSLARQCRADLVHAHFGYSGAAAMGVDVPRRISASDAASCVSISSQLMPIGSTAFAMRRYPSVL